MPSHGQGERRPQAPGATSEESAGRSGGIICGMCPGPPPPPAAAGASRRQPRPGPTPGGEGRLPAGGEASPQAGRDALGRLPPGGQGGEGPLLSAEVVRGRYRLSAGRSPPRAGKGWG